MPHYIGFFFGILTFSALATLLEAEMQEREETILMSSACLREHKLSCRSCLILLKFSEQFFPVAGYSLLQSFSLILGGRRSAYWASVAERS